MQDYGRAVVVGDISTHGKGTVQSLNPLDKFIWPATPTATNDPGTLKITIRKFYRVTGASTQLKGVEPDIVLPDVLNYDADIGERALENPLPWDSIRGVDFTKFNLVQPYLADLEENRKHAPPPTRISITSGRTSTNSKKCRPTRPPRSTSRRP